MNKAWIFGIVVFVTVAAAAGWAYYDRYAARETRLEALRKPQWQYEYGLSLSRPASVPAEAQVAIEGYLAKFLPVTNFAIADRSGRIVPARLAGGREAAVKDVRFSEEKGTRVIEIDFARETAVGSFALDLGAARVSEAVVYAKRPMGNGFDRLEDVAKWASVPHGLVGARGAKAKLWRIDLKGEGIPDNMAVRAYVPGGEPKELRFVALPGEEYSLRWNVNNVPLAVVPGIAALYRALPDVGTGTPIVATPSAERRPVPQGMDDYDADGIPNADDDCPEGTAETCAL